MKIDFLGGMKDTKAPNGPIAGYNMLHYLNEYLIKEGGPTTDGGMSLGGDPKVNFVVKMMNFVVKMMSLHLK